MDPGMFRGIDKLLYACMTLILLVVLGVGFLIGRCH